MQKLEIRDEMESEAIVANIIALVVSEKSLSVYAVGADAIQKTISAIGAAKKLLSKEDIVLDIKPIFSEREVQGDETKTSITFQIMSTPLFVEIALLNPKDETIPQALN